MEDACFCNKGFGDNGRRRPTETGHISSEEAVNGTAKGICFSGIKQLTSVKKDTNSITTKENGETERVAQLI
jgi:hypothetical protein